MKRSYSINLLFSTKFCIYPVLNKVFPDFWFSKFLVSAKIYSAKYSIFGSFIRKHFFCKHFFRKQFLLLRYTKTNCYGKNTLELSKNLNDSFRSALLAIADLRPDHLKLPRCCYGSCVCYHLCWCWHWLSLVTLSWTRPRK